MDQSGRDELHYDELCRLARSTQWFMRLLEAAQQVAPRDWVIGGGVVRNLVWDHLHDHAEATHPRDIDLVYFDPTNLDDRAEKAYEDQLTRLVPEYRWQVKNQAGVHRWYESVFGYAIPPVSSIQDAVRRFPETCTAVAVALDPDGRLTVLAPHGLSDLFQLVLRRNPTQVRYDLFLRRLREKRVQEIWPKVTVVYEDQPAAADQP